MRSTSKRVLSAAVATTVASLIPASAARAVDYVWNVPAGGAQSWQVGSNWTPAGFPSANVDRADLRVNLASSLTLDVGATDVAVGSLSLGGTGAAVTTDVTSTGGTLRLGADGVTVPSLVLLSQGTAGAVNRVSANSVLLGNLSFDATSTRDFTFAGNIQMEGGNRTITNNVAGPVVLKLGSSPTSEIRTYDALDPLVARTLTLSAVANSITEINGTVSRGPNNVGTFNYDAGSANTFATYIYNAPQTFSGGLQRSTYVANDNLAFGPGTITAAGAGTLTVTGNFTTGNGNQANWAGTITTTKPGGVTLPNLIILGNSNAFAGNENIVLSGALTQGNNRALGNAMASGKTLTLTPDPVTNPTGISIGISRVLGDGNRTWIVEGTGTTVINGLVVNNLTDDTLAAVPVINGSFEKRGSGRTELNNGGNTIRGEVRARGGNLVFGAANSWGTPTGISVQTNGGIWYTPGVGAAGWDDGPNSLVAKILNTSTGFFAVPASAAATNFDFSTGNMNLNAKNIGIGADGNVTFTGTVTPDAAVGYNWGGNTGTLTLGANASVGAHNVNYKNGGTVVLTGTQSYTGITSIQGANMVTSQAGILTKTLNSTSTTNVFTTTVLSTSSIANGGVDSGLGASSNAATNLVISGGTLRYTGGAASTDRLFSIGNQGGTIDSAGTGALQLTNAGANLTTGTGARTLTLTGANSGGIAGALTNGTLVTDTLAVSKTGAGTWTLSGASSYTGGTTVSGGTLIAGNGDAFGNGAITVNAGAVAQAQPGLTKAVSATTVTTAGTGKLDLTNNDLVVKGSTLAAVQASLLSGFNTGTWDGPGIQSSAAATDPNGFTALGYLSNADLGATEFSGVTVDADDILVKYTYYGDADLSGNVTLDDYSQFLFGFQNPVTAQWSVGDFDYSGTVTLDDFSVFLLVFQNQGGPLGGLAEAIASDTGLSEGNRAAMMSAIAAVPEPGTLGVLALAGAGMLGRRRSRRA